MFEILENLLYLIPLLTNIFRYHAISDTEDFGAVTFKIPEVALRCSNFETGLQYHSKYSFCCLICQSKDILKYFRDSLGI